MVETILFAIVALALAAPGLMAVLLTPDEAVASRNSAEPSKNPLVTGAAKRSGI